MDVRIVAVAPEFEVRVERAPLRASDLHAREIDRLWEAESVLRQGKLRDTTLLAHVHADRRHLVGRFVRHRDVVAGRRAPELFDGRPPVPVCISAMVTTRGRVVLGRRAEHLDEWPGRWELLPACGLDPSFHDPASGRLDFVSQLLAGLVEQSPLPHPRRDAVLPFALVHMESEPAWSLCAAIDLDLGEDAVQRVEESATATHDAFRVVRPVDVVEAGLWDGDELVPLSWALVRLPRAERKAA